MGYVASSEALAVLKILSQRVDTFGDVPLVLPGFLGDTG